MKEESKLERERLARAAQERWNQKMHDLITEEEIEQACSRIIFGSTPIKLLHTRRCKVDGDKVVQRTIMRRVGNILMLDGPGNMTITVIEWTKYLRDRSVPIGRGFISCAGSSWDYAYRIAYYDAQKKKKENAKKTLKVMSDKLDEHGVKCDWHKMSVFGR